MIQIQLLLNDTSVHIITMIFMSICHQSKIVEISASERDVKYDIVTDMYIRIHLVPSKC